MIKLIINNIIKYLVQMDIIQIEETAVYEYGIELLLVSIFNAIWILVLGIVLKCPVLSVIYIYILASVRTQIGGYHAQTYIGCFVCYNLFFLVDSILSSYFTLKPLRYIDLINIFLIGIVYILLIHKFAPIPRTNSMDKYEMKEANRKASINSAFWICFALILENYKKYWSYETISVLFISIMLMFLEKLKQLNNEKNRI